MSSPYVGEASETVLPVGTFLLSFIEKPLYSFCIHNHNKPYFTTEKLPQEIGDEATLTLQEMIDLKLLLPFTDKNGDSCDTEKSYVTLTRKENSYEMKVNLKCNEQEDYLLTIALISVIFGVIVLFCADVIAGVFRIIIGLWIIVAGIRDFQTALAWKNVKSGLWTLTLVLSMLMMIAGIIVLVSTTLAIQLVGVIIAIYAVLDIITRAIFIKKVKNYLDD